MSNQEERIIVVFTAVILFGSTAAIAVPAGGLVHGGSGVESAATAGELAARGSPLQASGTGYRPNETGPTDGPNVSVDWAAAPGGRTTEPTVVNGSVFVGTGNGNNALYAYNLTTGAQQWRFSLNNRSGQNIKYRPTVHNGTVYAVPADGDDTVYAVDATDGTLQWQTSVNGSVTRPIATDGGVFFGSSDPGPFGTSTDRVHSLDPATGSEEWRFELDNPPTQPVIDDGRLFIGTIQLGPGSGTTYAINARTGGGLWNVSNAGVPVAVRDGSVFIVEENEVTARDVVDGTLRWRHDSSASTFLSAAVDDDTVYVATTGSSGLSALNWSTGTIRWRETTDQPSDRPVVTGNSVYLGAGSGRVYAFSQSGDRRWTRVYDDAVGGLDVADGRLFVGGSSSLRAYTDTGARLPDPTESADNDGYDPTAVGPTDGSNVSVDWEVTPGGRTTEPTVANGRAFVGTNGSGNSLYAYNLTTGAQQWRFSLNNRSGQNIKYRPTVHNGTVYAVGGDSNDTVYAVDAGDGTLQWQTSVNGSVTRPIATDGGVFIVSNGLRSLDPVTGAEEWRFDRCCRTQPVIDDGRLYSGTLAINARTGGGLWKVNDGNVRGVAVRDGSVYVAKDDEVTARDAVDGTLRWRHNSSASTFLSAAVDDDTVYVATTNSSGLSALNRSTGTIRWRETTDQPSDRPVVTGNGVYLGADSGRVYAFSRAGDVLWTRVSDAAVSGPAVAADRVVVGGSSSVRTYTDTGARLPDPTESAGTDADGYDPTSVGPTDNGTLTLAWNRTIGSVDTTAPETAAGRVFVGTSNGDNTLYAYNLTTGDQEWRFSLNNRNGRDFKYRPTVRNGTVYAIAANGSGDGVAVYAVSAADGTFRWQTAVDGSVRRPVATGGGVFLASNGLVRSLNPATGDPEWQFELDGGVRTQPVVDDGRLYVGTYRGYDRGFTYAINARTGGGLWKRNDGNVRGFAVRDGSVFVAKDDAPPLLQSHSTEVTARDAADGALLWRHDGPANAFLSVATDGDRVFTATRGSTGVTALDAANGDPLARKPTSAGVSGRVILARGGAFFGTGNGSVVAVNRSTDDQLWTRTVGSNASEVAVTGTRLVVSNGSGGVVAYNGTGWGSEIPPEVTLAVSNTTVGVNETVTFEATASDPDGNVTAIAWDFDGDGTADATGPTASTQYAATGQYPVSVTVTDDTGLTATASTTVSVETQSATPPSVTASVSNATVEVNETVTFEATASDPDGNVNTITWDFDGDGTVDANGSTVSTSFRSAGEYDVNVTVTDDTGLTATDTVTVTVTVEAPNATPPSVTASVTNATVEINQTVTFEATASDPDGTVQTIEWDFDSDGVVDANGSTVSTSFQSAGEYDVNVTVTDDAGLTATDTVSLTVTATVETSNPFGSDGLPGGASDQPPTDVDGDGQYEDLNGDDRFTFVDIIEFIFALQSVDYSTLPQAQIDAVDFNGDGTVNFVDVVELVFEL
jgi:outer membrane protein assembly factor BamB